MPRLRYTGGSRYALRDGPTWDDGDVYEVSESTADRLATRDGFEVVDDADETEADAFDADAWLEQDYRTRADRVGAGDFDEHLATIREVETSATVMDAVDERLEEL